MLGAHGLWGDAASDRRGEHCCGVQVQGEGVAENKGVPHRDITFSQLEGDFREYEGTWKILGEDDADESQLVYMLRVKPQPWLPVSLVMRKVSQEVKTNLACVRRQAEGLRA